MLKLPTFFYLPIDELPSLPTEVKAWMRQQRHPTLAHILPASDVTALQRQGLSYRGLLQLYAYLKQRQALAYLRGVIQPSDERPATSE